MSNSGVVSRIAGDAIGADGFLPNMGTEDFLLCLSRHALEAAAKSVNLVPRARVRETRAALVDHFATDAAFVLPAALFAPDPKDITDLMKHADAVGDDSDGAQDESIGVDGLDPTETGHDDPVTDPVSDEASDEEETAYGIAAE
ncbi:hypothetical protein EV128_1148 [Rhizobium azibense]|nr:hypothetical protein EV128_1148 [Rhizobium azibense]